MAGSNARHLFLRHHIMAKRNEDPICLRAALMYAERHDLYSFPARMEVTASGSTKKYSWLSAEHAPEHLNWGMTKNPEQLRENFCNLKWRLKCGVGLPTGAINKIFIVEADTVKGHGVDGLASLKALEKQHGELPKTLMAKSPTGSVHRYYRHPGDIRLKSMAIAAGVDVKADGGMVVAPPSKRPDGGVYKWINPDHPIADAPQWLIDLIEDKERPAVAGNGHDDDDPWEHAIYEPLSDEEKTIGCAGIRDHLANEDDDWDTWNTKGMKIWNAVADSRGLEAFDGYSQRSDKYDEEATRKKWLAYSGSPPTNIGQGSFVWLVNEAIGVGWRNEIDEEPEEEVRIEENFVKGAKPKVNGPAPSSVVAPADLWDSFYSPPLPLGLLPKIIEDYALTNSVQIGCDAAGLAMGALVACAAVIPDRIQVQAKKHAPHWLNSARIWIAIVGASAAMKTPIYREVMRPIGRIDKKLVQEYMRAKQAWENLEPAEKRTTPPPACLRVKIEDITIESAQGIFADNPDGLMMARNELAAWFGAMDKYSGGKGAHADRGFWLATYDGGGYTFDRVKRGSQHIENLGLSLLGGIQPSVIRKVSYEGSDDGLIERLNPIVCRDGTVGQDLPMPAEATAFEALIDDLYDLRSMHMDEVIQFSEEARGVREAQEHKWHELVILFQPRNQMFASHIGKYHGMFVRMCLLWHMIENRNENWKLPVSGDIARRVATFMDEFLLKHAAAFYYGVLDLNDEQEKIRTVGGFILAHKLTEVSNRDVQRGTNSVRDLKQKDIQGLFEQLHALGWLERLSPKRAGDPPRWKVNPAVHEGYTDRAKDEQVRRENFRAKLLELRSAPEDHATKH